MRFSPLSLGLQLASLSFLPFVYNLQVFREYYPTHERTVTLECVWETDKFVLHERVNEPSNKDSDVDKREEAVSFGVSAVQYQSIDMVLGGKFFQFLFPLPPQNFWID